MEVCKKQTSVFYTIEPLGEKFYPGGFLFAKNSKNYVKTVVKRKPVSLLIWRDILLWKFFKIYIQTSTLWDLVSMGIMEGYFFA